MKNSVTVVRDDSLIIVDSIGLYIENFEEKVSSINLIQGWRAIQFHNGFGEIEVRNGEDFQNVKFTQEDYALYVQAFVSLWEGQKSANDEAAILSLDELKEIKYNEINAKRDLVEVSGFEYLGSIFDTDEKSFMRILGADNSATKALQAGLAFEIEWTLADNSKRVLNAEEILGFIPAFAAYSNALHIKANALKEEAKNALTKEALDAIVWG